MTLFSLVPKSQQKDMSRVQSATFNSRRRSRRIPLYYRGSADSEIYVGRMLTIDRGAGYSHRFRGCCLQRKPDREAWRCWSRIFPQGFAAILTCPETRRVRKTIWVVKPPWEKSWGQACLFKDDVNFLS